MAVLECRPARVSLRAQQLTRWIGAALPFAWSLGCTELDPGSDALFEDVSLPSQAGAMSRGPAELADAATPPSDARWACLERPESERAVALRSRVTLSLTVSDIGSRTAPGGLRARACSRLDVSCEAPLANGLGAAEGPIELELPQGFSGFIEITSEASVPALYFTSRPLNGDVFESLFVVSPTNLSALAGTARVRLDMSAGHLLVRAFDCEGAPASGVRIASDAAGDVFSFQNGLPDFGTDVTTAEGLVGYVNVPGGLAFLEGRELEAGRICGETSVFVRGGWLTYGDVKPLAR